MSTSGQQVVNLVLALTKAGDLDLLPKVAPPDVLPEAIDLALIVKDFDYLRSAEFASLTQGRSEAIITQLRRQYQDPIRWREKRAEFHETVRHWLGGADLQRFLPIGSDVALAGLRARLVAGHDT